MRQVRAFLSASVAQPSQTLIKSVEKYQK